MPYNTADQEIVPFSCEERIDEWESDGLFERNESIPLSLNTGSEERQIHIPRLTRILFFPPMRSGATSEEGMDSLNVRNLSLYLGFRGLSLNLMVNFVYWVACFIALHSISGCRLWWLRWTKFHISWKIVSFFNSMWRVVRLVNVLCSGVLRLWWLRITTPDRPLR